MISVSGGIVWSFGHDVRACVGIGKQQSADIIKLHTIWNVCVPVRVCIRAAVVKRTVVDLCVRAASGEVRFEIEQQDDGTVSNSNKFQGSLQNVCDTYCSCAYTWCFVHGR
jgi:hypothetical protein